MTVKKLSATGAACAAMMTALLISCDGKSDTGSGTTVPAHGVPRIVKTLPHSSRAFTQGLCLDGGILYESDGLYEESALRTLDTAGAELSRRSLPINVFAEGCAILSGKLYQLTWREQRCYVYTLPDLTLTDSLQYSGEGWGLAADGTQLIMSNGSDTLYFRDAGFALIKKVPVTCEGKPLRDLNELEFARGRVYANVWFSDYIFEIDPQRGVVERIIDCSTLVEREAPASNDCVLNGIAWNPAGGLFYLTGKKWKNLFVAEIPAP